MRLTSISALIMLIVGYGSGVATTAEASPTCPEPAITASVGTAPSAGAVRIVGLAGDGSNLLKIYFNGGSSSVLSLGGGVSITGSWGGPLNTAPLKQLTTSLGATGFSVNGGAGTIALGGLVSTSSQSYVLSGAGAGVTRIKGGTSSSQLVFDGWDAASSLPKSTNTDWAGKCTLGDGFSASFHGCTNESGAAKCWGRNDFGQLGDGSTMGSMVAVQVSGLTSGITGISTGYNHSCAISGGLPVCWGRNDYGQLGDGTSTSSTTPVAVTGLGIVSAIYAGYNHSCAILSPTNSLYCWGRNDYGQLGNATLTDSSSPVQVQGLTSGVTNASAGFSFSCAVVSGSAKCWGRNSSGQLGNGTTTSSSTPVQVSGLTSSVTQISAAIGVHACAAAAGSAKCWGFNSSGMLGNGTTTSSSTPVQVTGLTSTVKVVSAGTSHTCAIHGIDAKCWGGNASGQLGNNSSTDSSTPVSVSLQSGNDVSIAAGNSSSCGQTGSQKFCWGGNTYGQLGNNTTTASLVPVQVTGL